MLAGALGCTFGDQANNLLGAAGVLTDFADRLGKAGALTYSAEYRVTGADDRGTVTEQPPVTLVQQPPNAAFITESGRFILTREFVYVCDTDKDAVTCNKSPNRATGLRAADAGLIAGVAGPAFVTPEVALGLIVAAAFMPGAKVSQSERTIAGQESLCAEVTNLHPAGSAPGGTEAPGGPEAPRDFAVCVTDEGVLASFSGSLRSGQAASVELISFTAEADPAAFAPPDGAKIVEVGPTPTPT
jgi:hypothetical protein